jgi:hypothetical protein
MKARRPLRPIAAALGLSFALIACGNPAETEATPQEGPDLADGYRQATWGSNVSVTYANGTLRYVSDGIPNHARQAEYAVGAGPGPLPNASNAVAVADPTRAQNYDFTIPTTPVKAAVPTSTNLGTIRVMISGASLFNPYEGDGSTVATQSNFAVAGSDGVDVWFLDSCNGHPTPMMGSYHYHALPRCVTGTVDADGGPSHLIGIAFDGYPIYGDRDINGEVVQADALDQCNGITSATPEFPGGVYHYVLLGVASAKSSIGCFTGVVDASHTRDGMPGT